VAAASDDDDGNVEFYHLFLLGLLGACLHSNREDKTFGCLNFERTNTFKRRGEPKILITKYEI